MSSVVPGLSMSSDSWDEFAWESGSSSGAGRDSETRSAFAAVRKVRRHKGRDEGGRRTADAGGHGVVSDAEDADADADVDAGADGPTGTGSGDGTDSEPLAPAEAAIQLCLELRPHGMGDQVRKLLASSASSLRRRAESVGRQEQGADEGQSAARRAAEERCLGEVAGEVAGVLRELGLQAEVEAGTFVCIGVGTRGAVREAFEKSELSSSDIVRIRSLKGSAQVQAMLIAVLNTVHVSAALVDALVACVAAGYGASRSRSLTPLTAETLSGLPLMAALEAAGLVGSLTPIHHKPTRCELEAEWGSLSLVFDTDPIPLEKIHGYFGPEIALYFAWLRLYTLYLAVPAGLGIIVAFHQWSAASLSVWSLIPFGIVLSLWSSLFIQMWRREQAVVVHTWMDGELELPEVRWEHRPGFRGTWVQHEATGMYILVYPTALRYAKYAVSGFVLFFFVAVVAAQIWGVQELAAVLADEYPACFDWNHLSATVAGVAGGPDDDKPSLRTCQMVRLAPGLVSALAIQVMAKVYQYVARRMNEWENYGSAESARNHLMAKLVVFSFVNNFASLFYLAFYVRDWKRLNQRLWIVLVVSQIVDNVKELVVPWLLSAVATRLWATPHEASAEGDAVAQTSRPRYDDTFDDWLEMTVQFAYVTLFGVSFPLAAALALANNLAEMRVDARKLCSSSGYARPEARAAASIGVWLTLLDIISIVGVLTNVALLVVTTNALDEWSASLSLPALFGVSALALKLFVVFVAEHFVLALKLFLRFIIPPVPANVAWARIIAETPSKYLGDDRGPFVRSMVRRSRPPNTAPAPVVPPASVSVSRPKQD